MVKCLTGSNFFHNRRTRLGYCSKGCVCLWRVRKRCVCSPVTEDTHLRGKILYKSYAEAVFYLLPFYEGVHFYNLN